MDSGLGGGPEGCEAFTCWAFGQRRGGERARRDKTHPLGRNDPAVGTTGGLPAAVGRWGRTRLFFHVGGVVAVPVVVVAVVAVVVVAAAAAAATVAAAASAAAAAAAKEEEARPMAIGAGAEHHAADDQGRKEDW